MATDAIRPRSPSLRRRFTLWLGLVVVVGAVLLRLAYYQAAVATLTRDLDELLWSRLGMVRMFERFEPGMSLARRLESDVDGRFLRQPSAADHPSDAWFPWGWIRRPRIDPGQLPWFAGVWDGEARLTNAVAWPDGLRWDPDWLARRGTIWTSADGRYRLAAADAGSKAMVIVGAERAAVAEAMRTIAWFEVRSFLVGVPLVLGAAWLLLARIFAPLAVIAATARRIRAGRFTERIDPACTDTEFQELAGTINEMLDRLEAIRGAQSRFNADVAHQLLNPVHAILLEAEAGERSVEPRAALERTGGLARRIEDLCEVLLAYSRSAALDPARLRPIDLEPVVADAIDRVTPLAAGRGIRIAPPPGGAVVKGDPALLEEVLVNLLGNAVDYSPAGGQIEVTLAADPTGCRLEVADHGPGVSADQRGQLFERFQSGKPGRGHGVGLALSRLIMRSHGGELEHEATPGGGATFVLRFPPLA